MYVADRICTKLARYYVNADSWNPDYFLYYFQQAHTLCERYVEEDKYECPLHLCALYNMSIMVQDCKTSESMNRVVDNLAVAINNCKVLSNCDSEFANQAWELTIDSLLKFNYYVSAKLTDNIADIWNNAFALFVSNATDFFTALACKSPLYLLPQNYRDGFSDFFLLTGNADSNFIKQYNTLLFTFYMIQIKSIHKNANGDTKRLRNRICEVYDSLIKCQKQGYAFQIYTKEKRELLELIDQRF